MNLNLDAFADLSIRVEEDEKTCKECLAVENFARYTHMQMLTAWGLEKSMLLPVYVGRNH